METPLADNKYKLEKFDGKGGWTYAVLHDIRYKKTFPFGWVKVKGKIDDCEINCNLMRYGKEQLFLPVKAEIRKKIGKKEGDWVRVLLYADDSLIQIPEELLLCLMDEPKAHETFLKFSQSEQKAYINWIAAAKKEETRIDRIAQTVNRVLKGQKFYDKYL